RRQLNRAAAGIAERIANTASALGVELHRTSGGASIIDCGVSAPGSLEAGRLLADACLAGLGQTAVTTGDASVWRGPWVTVSVNQPVAACLASQYAGWRGAPGKV